MKTKLFTLFLALIIGAGTMLAGTKIGNLYYVLNDKDKTAQVTYARYQDAGSIRTYYGPDITEANIPDQVNGYKVTSIGSYAFSNCTHLTSVIIGGNVVSIGEKAFNNCSALASINIGENVSTIYDGAFLGCYSLPVVDNIRYADTYLQGVIDHTQENYTIQEGTKWIGSTAFSECHKLRNITIPESVVSIGERAFYECDSITHIDIPNNVVWISNRAFAYCKSLVSITIGNGVRKIGWQAFGDCNVLDSINISDLEAWCSINFNTDYMSSNPLCGNSRTLYLNGNPLREITIPNSVTRLGDGIFMGYKNLNSIRLSNNVTYIGNSSFAGCDSLTSLIIPNSVDTIEKGAFLSCSNLNSVIIGNSVRFIGNNAFSSCKKLTSLIIGEKVKSMANAFTGCSNLKDIYCFITYPLTDGYINCRHDESNPVNWYVSSNGKRTYELTEPWKSAIYYHYIYLYTITTFSPIDNSEVNIVPSEWSSQYAELNWPRIRNGAYYLHKLKKDGETIESFVSDNVGHRFFGDFEIEGYEEYHDITIDTLTGRGWTTGSSMNIYLESGKTYTYCVTALDSSQIILYSDSVEYVVPNKTYTITFSNWNGDLLLSLDVEEGTIPEYHGATPIRPDDEEYTYKFIGWSPEIVAATEDASYIATYEAKPIGEGIEDIQVNESTPNKIMVDGHILIRRGDKTYTLQGQEVK